MFPDRFEFETIEEPHEQWGNDTIVLGYKVNHSNETQPAYAVAGDHINMSIMISTKTSPFPIIKNYTFTVRGTLEKTGTPRNNKL